MKYRIKELNGSFTVEKYIPERHMTRRGPREVWKWIPLDPAGEENKDRPGVYTNLHTAKFMCKLFRKEAKEAKKREAQSEPIYHYIDNTTEVNAPETRQDK